MAEVHVITPAQPLSTTPPTPRITTPWGPITDNRTAALYWHGFGFVIIPILPEKKCPATAWEQWTNGVSPEIINKYWRYHTDHEVGFIVGDGLIVFDADGPESVMALRSIETRFSIEPMLVSKTSRGEHHFFQRAAGTIARSDSHDSVRYPDRIDVKTGRALIVLPPSTGKSISSISVTDKSALSVASQDFIDAVYQHNGRVASSAPQKINSADIPCEIAGDGWLLTLARLLECIDPDCGYDDWLHVGMALFNETGGSGEGMSLYNSWSENGLKYKDIHEIEAKWRSFTITPHGYNVATLIYLARKAGADTDAILYGSFEVIND